MNIDEAKFKILEQNIQSLTQAVYKLVYSLSDLKLLLARDKILVHPEEKSDIPPHSLFAQTKRFLEKNGFEFAEKIVHTEPAKTCKACSQNYANLASPPLICLGSSGCACRNCENKRRRQSCTGDYYGAL